LSKCCLAITKPGTVTLELALLKVPALMIFKTSWLTYLLGRSFVKTKYMSLPNLLLGFEVYKELIQSDCKVDLIVKEVENLYFGFIKQSNDYVMKVQKLNKLRTLLSMAK
jgi:lipid-A-disaccharide synthase